MNTPSPAEQATKPLAPPSTSIQLLGAARDIQEQRARDYDHPGGERSMQATVEAFNIITRRGNKGTGLTESEGWLLMQILKDVRDRSTDTPHRDSLEDGISYSSLKAESRLKEGAVNQPAQDDDMVPRSAVDVSLRSDMYGLAVRLKQEASAEITKDVIQACAGVRELDKVPVKRYMEVAAALRKELNARLKR